MTNNRWRLSVRLQSIHREPIGAGSTERQDQRGEYEAVPKAEESGGERGGQVQSESRRHGAGLRHLRESGNMKNVRLVTQFENESKSESRIITLSFLSFFFSVSPLCVQAQLNKNKFRITEGQSFR